MTKKLRLNDLRPGDKFVLKNPNKALVQGVKPTYDSVFELVEEPTFPFTKVHLLKNGRIVPCGINPLERVDKLL